MATAKQAAEYIKQGDEDEKDGGKRHLTAPKGMFRLIGVDTIERPTEDYLIDDYKTFKEAQKACKEHGGQMSPCYVYDDEGILLFQAGSF